MSSIGTALLDSLRSIERSGDFCISGVRHIFMPTIDVDRVGLIALPLVPFIARLLPLGDGEVERGPLTEL